MLAGGVFSPSKEKDEREDNNKEMPRRMGDFIASTLSQLHVCSIIHAFTHKHTHIDTYILLAHLFA